MTPAFQALTAYGVQIPRALHDRQAAMTWARQHGDKFPGARIVQHTKTGPRTIWRADLPNTPAAEVDDLLAARTLETQP